MENQLMVTEGFGILVRSMAPYIAREFEQAYGPDWWKDAVLDKLYDEQKRDLPLSGDWATLVDSLDIQRCLLLFDLYWNDIFRKKLSVDHRTWAKELKGIRNRWAHAGGQGFSDDDTWRALDTMSRLCEQIDPEGAGEIRQLQREMRYGTAEGSIAVVDTADAASVSTGQVATASFPVEGLPSWRDIIEPHQDVAQGRYRNAEFAADLAQVARGEGSFEYRDPVEFFGRTYVTEGMKGLLVQSIRRVTGQDGEPVIQLKTAFGGGKTHSMLALYHLMRGRVPIDSMANVKPVLDAADVDALPKVNVAVLVGTALNPTKNRRPPNMPGITINTLWGEMAAQLAESAGDPALYDYVKDADRKGVSPGSKAMADLFDACGPCLVLMDELVAYAKKLYRADGLPAGTFDNFITFIQEITEAARASRNSLVVASIPESELEVGGEAGQQALDAIEHTFGRMEAIWKPVTASEGFEVVRRRLFLDCKDPAGRDDVCARFSQLYAQNASEFPVEARELDYRDRMIACYPIHPELFDRLYEDWATLERFQRTRGVLRLMASIIHELWMAQDASPMIMPGSMPMNVPAVKNELTRYLDEGWNAVVDSEVDGKKSIPYKKDEENPRYGRLIASRRISRTIMLGSAPDVGAQTARGIEKAHIRLGTVLPDENISVFNDALSTLQSASSYLYSDVGGNRFWYDTRPTLRKTVEDRVQQISDERAIFEVENRLKKLRKTQPFSGLHVCPTSSLDIPDEQTLRLVVLSPSFAYQADHDECAAMKEVTGILANRGTSPRVYKNMLAFVVADAAAVAPLKQEAKRYLAWQSVKDDRIQLNLDAVQNRETDNNIRRCDNAVDMKMQEAYCWLLSPSIDLASGSMDVIWDRDRIAGGTESVVEKAGRKLVSNEAAIIQWAPALLRMELDRVLWKDRDEIQIKQLWTQLCSYCYLPRLASYSVLESAIQRGLGSDEYFGLVAGIGDGRYLELRFDEPVTFLNQSDYLVKPDVARAQIERERLARAVPTDDAHGDTGTHRPPVAPSDSGTSGSGGHDDSSDGTSGIEVSTHDPTAFRLTTVLDNTHLNKNVGDIVNEIVYQIMQLDESDVEVTLDVKARVDSGIPVPTVRAVSENCKTLHVDDFGFNE